MIFKPSIKKIRRKYLKYSASYGDALSYSYIGEPVFSKGFKEKWRKWLILYAEHGYKPMTIREMVSYGGYGDIFTETKSENALEVAETLLENLGDFQREQRRHPMRKWVTSVFREKIL